MERTDEFVIDVGEMSLPKLKTLHINDVSFANESGAAFPKLVSGCHALEELVMREDVKELRRAHVKHITAEKKKMIKLILT
ncbi:hypothetical protein Bca52824_021737 [Brassica carinata]|uniref:Uncharacterized protein n=1 Tax=Brassica carinata TaxID=52824 RepID=A0A8X8AQN4_BRACI|nr:hypothetical protein Bca52824_021737 [Brassica carinata]